MNYKNKPVIVNGKFLLHRISGVERYARELLRELDKIVVQEELIIAIPPELSEYPDYKNIKIIKVGMLHNNLWEQISFPIFVRKMKGISLNLCNTAPLISPGIVCIHDVKIRVRPYDYKKLFLLWYRLLFYNECKRAQRLITVSYFSKREICRYYKVNSNCITVIPNAWQHIERIRFDENTLNKYGLDKGKYYFSISSLEPNKNLEWIVHIAKQREDQLFVVAGTVNRKVFANSLKFTCARNLRLLGYISDEESKTLMRYCKAFVFPSFYEGFGIPPLEALGVGAKEIITSDIPVMREIFESYASYVNPYRFEMPVDEVIISESSRRRILKKYSWNMSAKDIIGLLSKTT